MDEKSTKLQETLQDRMHWELCEFILLLFVKLLLYFFNNLLLCCFFFDTSKITNGGYLI